MKNSKIIIETRQNHFDFSKTTKEKEATKHVISMHKQELIKYYGKNVYYKYKNRILNCSPVLRDELIAAYKKFIAQLNKQNNVRIFQPKLA